MLSNQSVHTLMDLLQNRISVMDVTDREDLRELTIMKRCLNELAGIAGSGMAIEGDFTGIARRGRRKKVAFA